MTILTIPSLLLALAAAACAAPLPNGPTSAAPPVLVLSGQSNARAVRPALNVRAAAAGYVVTGWAEGGDAIGSWGPTTDGWIGWVQPALAAPGVVAFVWMQGEYEAPDPNLTAAYGPLLADLMRRVRAAAGQPALRVILSEVSMRADYAGMRAVQKAYVASDPNARLVSTEDLQDDGGHFTAAGYDAIAARILGAVR